MGWNIRFYESGLPNAPNGSADGKAGKFNLCFKELDGKMKPKKAIQQARMNFMFAAIQFVAMRNNLYTYRNLPKGANWSIDNKTLYIKWEGQSDEGFTALVENQMRTALGVWATTVNSMFNDTYKNEPYEDTNEERRAVRCIVYMYRCAFAHNPIEPKWNVTNDKYDGVFEVPSINYVLSTKDLNGKPLGKESFDWFGVINLMQYCETLVG